MEIKMEELQYPVGPFDWSVDVSEEERGNAIKTIESFPSAIREAVESLSEAQLDTPYRPEGWTVRQVVHHVADSHMNAYIRFKLALTEDEPTIKPYDQAEWAKLPDSKLDPGISLDLIAGVHKRWISIMNNMSESDWERKFKHPEHGPIQMLKKVASLYGWHCQHHLAHVTRLIEREGW